MNKIKLTRFEKWMFWFTVIGVLYCPVVLFDFESGLLQSIEWIWLVALTVITFLYTILFTGELRKVICLKYRVRQIGDGFWYIQRLTLWWLLIPCWENVMDDTGLYVKLFVQENTARKYVSGMEAMRKQDVRIFFKDRIESVWYD